MPAAELDTESSRPPRKPEVFQPTFFLPGTQVPLDTPKLRWFFVLNQRWGEVKVVWILRDVSSLDADDWQWGGGGVLTVSRTKTSF